MRRLNPWMLALAAAVVIFAVALLVPGIKQRNIASGDFASKAAEGVATGGAPKPPERP